MIEASRDFVCIRLATYEDQAEADFMSSIYKGRSGQLENTTFAILSPDGKKKLTAVGRGPFHEYRDSQDMARGMSEIAAKYPPADKRWSDQQLPSMKSLDVGLNVAASDSLPVVVLVTDSDKELSRLNQLLLPLAWHSKLAGQYVFAHVRDNKKLKPLTGVKKGSGILLVEPGQFGQSGKVVAQLPIDVSSKDLEKKLTDVVAAYAPVKMNHDAHVQLGIQLGIDWKSEIPETDQQSLRAKERIRGKR